MRRRARRELAEWGAARRAGVGGGGRVRRGVAGLRGPERGVAGRTFAHFPDENHVGRLAQRRAHAVRIVVEIMTKLALIKSRPARGKHEFNRRVVR